MPIYEYQCEACMEVLEVIQKVSDDPMETCPSCQSNSLKKKTSMSAFHLKGGGWYKDGYGGKSDEKDIKTSTTEDKKSSKVVETKSTQKESKPAATSIPQTSKAS